MDVIPANVPVPADKLVPSNNRHQLTHMQTRRIRVGSKLYRELRAIETALFRPWCEFVEADKNDQVYNPERGIAEDNLHGVVQPDTARNYDNALASFLAWLFPKNPMLAELGKTVFDYANAFKRNAFSSVRSGGNVVPALCARMPALYTDLQHARTFFGIWRRQNNTKIAQDKAHAKREQLKEAGKPFEHIPVFPADYDWMEEVAKSYRTPSNYGVFFPNPNLPRSARVGDARAARAKQKADRRARLGLEGNEEIAPLVPVGSSPYF